MRTELAPAQAAAEYEQRLRAHFASDGVLFGSPAEARASTPRFDLVLLGLGSDGHTASLFPHAPALLETHAWVTTHAPSNAPARITLTFPVLNNARAVLFLVAGADKAEALRRVFEPSGNTDDVPARGIAPTQGTLTFFTDRAAASALEQKSPLPLGEG
jgi:6-phosphogluconolactonase